MRQEKREEISQETLDYYAPFATRLGIHKIKAELEDLSLFNLHPKEYTDITKHLSYGREARERYVEKVKEFLSRRLKEFGIQAEVDGRNKHIYSIWRKMRSQNLPFEQIFDLVAFRIIVSEVQECYSALGVIHSIFKPIPGRFNDYISLPKNNGYRSLHTAVIGLKSMRMEIQIRTKEMHSYAEDGIAAHWRYKDGGRVSDVESQRIGALRAILSWQSSLDDPRSFIASIKESLAEKDAIYVFTPNGDVRELPAGATPIDFAYFIHTEIGHHTSGARVNGVMASIRQKLQNGDTVEIITSRVASPSPDWLRHVASPKAKAKIRQWLGAEERKQALEFGRTLIIQEMRRHKIGRDRLTPEILQVLGFKDFDELDVAVAYSKLPVQAVVAAMRPELRAQAPPHERPHKAKAPAAHDKPSPGILVKGVGDVFVRHGKCCSPVPGEPITGFLTQGNGVTVHSADCRSLMGLDPDRLVEVSWADAPEAAESGWDVHVRVKPTKIRGAYSRVVSAITEHSMDILEAHAGDGGDDIPWFKVAVRDYAQYQSMIAALKAMTNVVEMVERFHPDEPEAA
jgi:GTP pyrophosphokinase